MWIAIALLQIRDSLIRLTATIEILIYIYKNCGFFCFLNTRLEYTKTLFAEKKKTVDGVSFSFFFLSTFLSRTLSFSSHSLITLAHVH